MLDYTITEKEAFTIAGIHRRFSFDTCYQEIPKFWEDWRAAETGMIGMFGVCLHIDDTGFDYWIADLLEEGK